MQYNAIIDTNVIISAMLSKNEEAATVQIIKLMMSGEIIPYFSHDVLKEYHEVLRREKFNFSWELITAMLAAIEKYGILVVPGVTDEILKDPKDLPFYEIVMDKQDDNAYLVTGNIKHFPSRPYIVTPREMLDIIER